MFTEADRGYMARALELAECGLYTTMPNPRVGCVLVRDGFVVGEGWHQRAGQAHAEVIALATAAGRAEGATAYVTLEPCAHHGRTPPCSQALIDAKVARVVAALRDPNPVVCGKGMGALAAAGVLTECGLMEDEAWELNVGFISRMTRGRPWLRLKVAASIDGKTALLNGASRWITGPEARRDGHRWRARACAVLTGVGTVKDDDPELTVREVETPRQPVRVVVDSRLEAAPSARVFGPGTLVALAERSEPRASELEARGVELLPLPSPSGKVDLVALLHELGRRGMNEVHVEAGARLNGSLLREGLVDELLIYLAPTLLGDRARGMFAVPPLEDLSERRDLELRDVSRVGHDLRIVARPKA